MISTLLQYNLHRQGEIPTTYIPRPRYQKVINEYTELFPVTVLVGMRRTGKTTLSKLRMYEHISSGEDPRTFCYVSCDHFLLQQYTLFEIIETVRTYHGFSHSHPLTMIFDEITTITDYQQQLKNIADLGFTRIVASSSQSRVLRDHKAFLTGRAGTIEVFPLTYDEYLIFRDIQISPADLHLRKKYFTDYIRDGGIPEYIRTGRPEVIKEITNDLIYKDIIAYHAIRDTVVVKDLFMLMLERNGKQISINKIANILGTSHDTVTRYLSYMQDTYLYYQVQRAGKTNEKIRSAKKWYIHDTGIKHVMTGRKDIGFAYETICCHARRMQGVTPYYGLIDGVEIDWCINKKLYESKFQSSLSPTQKRIKDLVVLDGLEGYEMIMKGNF